MDQKTFFEYWATPGKYVAHPEAVAYSQAAAIEDPYPYGILCRQIAYAVFVHWEMARITEYRTFQKMLSFVADSDNEVTDENIWDGSGEWDGLYQLTLDTCLEVLTAPELDLDTLFAQQVDDASYQPSPASPNPEPWWRALTTDLRQQNALPLYKIAVILRFFDIDIHDNAARLNIPPNDIGRLQVEAEQSILASLRTWSDGEHARINDATNSVIERINRRIDLPEEGQ